MRGKIIEMKSIRLLHIILAIAASITNLSAQQNVIDSLYAELPMAETATDSIHILYNILDCSPTGKQGKILEQLYELSLSQDDQDITFDIIRQESNHYSSNDSMQQVLLNRTMEMTDSPQKRMTELFIKVRASAKKIRNLPEAERQQDLRDYLARHSASKRLDTYEKIEYLFYLCAYLRSATDGDLLIKYFKELQQLIDSLPARDIALRSLFYTQAAVSYLSNDMFEEAVDANKKLLDIIVEFEKQYKAEGRIYRNYDRSRYICYRRLLLCHSVLSPEEIDYYYEQLLSLASHYSELERDLQQRKRPTIYYLMAKERYAEALPLIKKLLDDPVNTREEYRYLVGAMITAAEATGNKDDLLKALKINNKLLRDRIIAKAAEGYKELQIIYEVNDLKQANDNLASVNNQMEEDRHRDIFLFSMIILSVLLILLGILYFLYSRSTHLAAGLVKSNKMLLDERDALKKAQQDLIDARDRAKIADRVKTDFVNNMSHEIRTPLATIVEYSTLIADCVDENNRSYIKRFADIVSLNTDLLLTLVNDVLDLPAIENAKINLHITPASAKEICQLAVDSVEKRVKPEVKLIFENESDTDISLRTDAHRVEQVILNMLSNATKFTSEGTITLGYSLSDDGQNIRFTVTDTGIGIPRGMEETIFERFEKVNSSTQGNGLGLYICRLLATLLNGTIELDAEYRDGARFIFTIPAE